MIRYIFFLLFINFPFESKLKKAIKKYEKGRYEKAIDILKSKNNNKNYDHYFYLGHSYSFIEKNEISILYYDSAINLNNKKDIAFFERGISIIMRCFIGHLQLKNHWIGLCGQQQHCLLQTFSH